MIDNHMKGEKNMGQKIIVLLTALCILFCAVDVAQAARERVSVLGFTGGVAEEYRQAAVNRLTTALMQLDRFDVVERAEIEFILEEQHFQLAGLVDQAEAVEIGKILGIDLAFLSSVDRLTASWDYENKRYRGEAAITVKIIDIETGRLTAAVERKGTGTDSSRQSSLHKALEGCFGAGLMQTMQENFSLQSEVFRVEGRRLYFLQGMNWGVKEGMRYDIFRAEELFFDGLETNEQFAYRRQIGMVEVDDVLENLSQGDILWAMEPVRQGDILQEVSKPRKGLFGATPRVAAYRLDEEDKNKYTVIWEVRLGTELPFRNTAQLVLGFSSLDDVNTFDIGFEGGWDFPLVRGKLYFIARGGAALSFAFQSDASALGGYLAGTGGLKYYHNYGAGPRVELGVTGQYGPNFSRWTAEDEQDVTDDMPHPRVGLSGFGLRLGIFFPF